MPNTSPSPGALIHRRRAVFWLSAGTLVLALVLPLLSVPASNSAARAPNVLQKDSCEPGFVWNEKTGQCESEQGDSNAPPVQFPPVVVTIPDVLITIAWTPTSVPQPTNTPQSPPTFTSQLQPTLTPQLQPTFTPQMPPTTVPPTVPNTPPTAIPTVPPDLPQTPSLAGIEITKWECPADLDPFSPQAVLLETCSSPATMPFTFTLAWSDGSMSISTADVAEWVGSSGTDYRISEEIAPGYGPPVAWCSLSVPGVAGTPFTRRDVDAAGAVIVDPPSAPGQVFACDFFNFPLANQIVIDKLVCPAGAIIEDDLDAYLAACPDDSTGGYEFTLTDGESIFVATTQVGTGDAATDSNVSWRGLGDGPFMVQEVLPKGSADPRVWCGSFPLDEFPYPETILLSPVDTTGGRWEGEFTDGPMRYVCYWFDRETVTETAAGESSDPTPVLVEPPEIRPVRVGVQKAICPPGTDRTLSGFALLERCDFSTSYPFTLTHGVEGGSESPSTENDGYFLWRDLDPGVHYVREDVPPGFDEPLVWCATFDVGETSAVVHPLLVEDGNTIVSELLAGEHLSCTWYNFATDDADVTLEPTHQIQLTDYTCPEATDRTLGLADLSAMCSPASSVEFTLAYDEWEWPRSTNASGIIVWEFVRGGPWSLDQTIPYESKVFCGPVGAASPPVVPSAGGHVEGVFAPEDPDLECVWFDFLPSEPPVLESMYGVDLTKYVCPDGVDRSLGLVDLSHACSPEADVEFTASYGGTTSTKTTGADGRVSWPNMRTGAWSIQETVPRESTVFCGPFTETDLPPIPEIGGRIAGGFATGDPNITCVWFDFEPAETTPDEHHLLVFKRQCPEGTDPTLGSEDLMRICPPLPGVEFTGAFGGTTRSETTDPSGSVSWHTTLDGPWSIQETDPGISRVFCVIPPDTTIHDMPVSGGRIEGSFAPGDPGMLCGWFNFDSDDGALGTHQLQITKFECPPGVDPSLGLVDLGLVCAPVLGRSLEASYGGTTSTKWTDPTGMVTWNDLPDGPWSVQDSFLAPSKVFCGPVRETEPPVVPSVDDRIEGSFAPGDPDIACAWFDFAVEDGGGVIVHKLECPAGTMIVDPYVAPCPEPIPMAGVPFTLTGPTGTHTLSTTSDGGILWDGVPPGELTLEETVPPGYEPLLVICVLARFGDTPLSSSSHTGTNSVTIDFPGDLAQWQCDFFDVPLDPGSITIAKWTCPAGYDPRAPGADPDVDCIEPADGIEFTLDPPTGDDQIQTTGDTLPGVVSFDGLIPGSYIITERLPDDIGTAFVWDCVGSSTDAVHPSPLSTGNMLTVEVASGDAIHCNWYNVPPPEDGTLTVYKFTCRTATFVSEVDCERYEHGASFELFPAFVDTSLGVGTTDAGGSYTWTGLDEGSYRLEELDREPCYVFSTNTDVEGNFWVPAGGTTIVRVYNCRDDITTATPDDPGKPPGGYPNTGAGGSGPAPVAAIQATPEPESLSIGQLSAEAFSAIDCMKQPILETPSPTVAPTPAGSEGSPGPSGTVALEDDCLRGAIPTHLTIEAAGIDADIAIVEVVDGVMQAPPAPHLAAWYKETARLGETNNSVISGHLNWWNVPKGVFYHLAELETGDRIEVTGNDGNTYVFVVVWTSLESNLEPPRPEVLGPTEGPSLTLITCGGEWDATVSEYTERTVVRAVMVDVIPEGSDEAVPE